MKPHSSSYLLIIFLLLFFISCFNSNSKRNDDIPPPPPSPEAVCEVFFKNIHLSKDTLKQIKILSQKAHATISETDIYTLMNQAIFPNDALTLPDSLCTKIVKRTSTFGEHLDIKHLKSMSPTYIEMEEVLYMFSQLSCNSTEWDCNRLKNITIVRLII